MLLVALGAGDIELKPARSLRLAPWEGATGFGAAYCVPVVVLVVMGGGRLGIEG